MSGGLCIPRFYWGDVEKYFLSFAYMPAMGTILKITPKNILKCFKNFIGMVDCLETFTKTMKSSLKLNIVRLKILIQHDFVLILAQHNSIRRRKGCKDGWFQLRLLKTN